MPLARIQVNEPGWVTFGQALPRGAAFKGLALAGEATQADIKCRWDDGSIKFAVVTARPSRTGEYELVEADPDTRTFEDGRCPDWWLCLYDYDREEWYGVSVYQDGLKWEWLNGWLVKEARQYQAFFNQQGEPHPFLRSVIDVRQYDNGEWRIDAAVENCLDSAGDLVRYSAYVGMGDVAVETFDNIEHPYLSRWRDVSYVDEDGGFESWKMAAMVPDLEPAIAANALPRYSPFVSAKPDDWNGYFGPLGCGLLNPYMPEHGGRPELAPYPDWAARYLVHKDPDREALVLAHGDLAGSWPLHVREDDGSLVNINQRPDYWLDDRAEPGNKPAGNMFGRKLFDPATWEGMTPEVNHQPSLAYIPYLLTGDRYYADEMALWANWTLLFTFAPSRIGEYGLIHGNEVRGFAWGLRELTDAAAYLPDDDPLKAYFVEKVTNNLAFLDLYADDHAPPLGHFFEDRRPENSDSGLALIALWELNYLAWAVDHASRQGFVGGATYRNRIVGLQEALFADQNTRDGAAPYLLPVGTRQWPGGPVATWFTSVRQAYYGPCQFAGYYGVDARLMLVIAEQLGFPSAYQDRLWLEGQPGMAEDLAGDGGSFLGRSGWFIIP